MEVESPGLKDGLAGVCSELLRHLPGSGPLPQGSMLCTGVLCTVWEWCPLMLCNAQPMQLCAGSRAWGIKFSAKEADQMGLGPT